MKRLLLGALFAVILVAGLASSRSATPGAKWMSGDFHEHTYFTDGSQTIRGVIRNGFRYGLDWVANSEHGGTSKRDGEGNRWDDESVYPKHPAKGDVNVATSVDKKTGAKVEQRTMWRWQTLIEYVYPILQELRGEFPNRLVAAGVEWNVPGHEHCSVGIIAPNSETLGEFEYRFDRGDGDTSGGLGRRWAGKNFENNHQKAVEAILWMKERHPKESWIVFAHPERLSSYTAADFRDFNDAAPEIAFGFEGLPGHQKSEKRGSYGEEAVGRGTYGGAGLYIAKVGGVWDALLGEGRHWWTFVSSDFHSPSGDFWPGEYAKTWSWVRDGDSDGRYTLEDVAESLRSGNSFAVHGDLIDRLEFRAECDGKSATMGETLSVKPGEQLAIKIRFRSPETNYGGDPPRVRLVQLITGQVREPASKFLPDGRTPNPEYAKETNETTRVAVVYSQEEIGATGAGWYELPAHELAGLDKDMYFRIRGTNLPANEPNETDGQGNPLADSEAREKGGISGEKAAWRDLWFYSNPIFVRVEESAAGD